jgi:hypothetical protein
MVMNKCKALFMITCVLLLALLVGCDWDIVVVSAEIAGVPNRIIYIASIDSELDLSGLKRISTQRNGEVFEDDLENWGKWFDGEEVRHEIDFTIPGVYEVELYYDSRNNQVATFDRNIVLSYKFFIQVIDIEWLDSYVK